MENIINILQSMLCCPYLHIENQEAGVNDPQKSAWTLMDSSSDTAVLAVNLGLEARGACFSEEWLPEQWPRVTPLLEMS
jgi:hypothetical protein